MWGTSLRLHLICICICERGVPGAARGLAHVVKPILRNEDVARAKLPLTLCSPASIQKHLEVIPVMALAEQVCALSELLVADPAGVEGDFVG